MGLIMRMNSKTFIKDFLPENNPEDFVFVLISENITTEGKDENIHAIPRLIPPPPVVSLLINGDKSDYQKAFLRFVSHPQIDPFVTIIMKAALVDNMNVVLMCSKSEDDLGYLKLLCDYIEEVYDVKTYSYKKYKENPEKASVFKNLDSAKKIVNKKLEEMKEHDVTFETKANKDDIVKDLKKMKTKELRKFAKKRKIKLDEDMGKKDIIRKLVKKLA